MTDEQEKVVPMNPGEGDSSLNPLQFSSNSSFTATTTAPTCLLDHSVENCFTTTTPKKPCGVDTIPEDQDKEDPLRYAHSLHAAGVNRASRDHDETASDSHSKQEYSEAVDDNNWATSSVLSVDADDEANDERNNKKNTSTLKDIVKQETHHVNVLRTRVMLFLATSAVLLSIAIGVSSTRLETTWMNESFAVSADFLLDQLRLRGQQSLNAVSSLAVSMTDSTGDLIFMSDEQFDLQAAFAQSLMWPNMNHGSTSNGVIAIASGVASIMLPAPVAALLKSAVPEPEAAAEGMSSRYVYVDPNFSQDANGTAMMASQENLDLVIQETHYPIQQVAPSSAKAAARMINLDVLSVPKVAKAMAYAMYKQGAVVSAVLTWEEQVQLGLLESETLADPEPMSLFIVPVMVMEEVDEVQISEARGAVLMPFYWSDILEHVYPEDIRGVEVVFQSSCDAESVFTYQINNEEVSFLGDKDAHTSYYDYSEKSTMLVEELWQGIHTPAGHNMTFAHGYECGMELRVYESAAFRTQHRTGIPAILTGTVVVILVFVIVLVLIYGGIVEFSLHSSVEKLAKTQHLVNSLFPKDVQEKMFHAQDLELEMANARAADNPMIKIHSAIKEAASQETKALPNAELYKCATILFADIAGFTQWSSGREPSNVFLLLENIYDAMDQLAKTRGVFKVETIGDCYMAVCGLPEIRGDHASVICRFAWDCIPQVKKVTRRLQRTLGGDTSKLGLRIGLHSGEVTAGVLRGEKARFQLFGDTVNTASRMESTGVPFRVQISSATAECLTKEDKEHWFAERKGGVEAKGKGRMRTFFLTNAVRSSQSSSDQSSSFSMIEASGRSQSGDEDDSESAAGF